MAKKVQPHTKETEDILAGLPEKPSQDDVSAVIREDINRRSAQVLELENALPQIEDAQANFLEAITSKNPDKKQVNKGTKAIAGNTVRLMELAHEGQRAQLEALDGEKKVAALKWLRDQETVKRQRAEETANKWLSWIGALGKQIGQAVGGALAGLIYSFKERRAESLAKRNRIAV